MTLCYECDPKNYPRGANHTDCAQTKGRINRKTGKKWKCNCVRCRAGVKTWRVKGAKR